MTDLQSSPATGRFGAKSFAALLLVAAVVWLWLTTTHDDKRPLFFGLWRPRSFVIALALVYIAALALLLSLSKRALFVAILATMLAAVTLLITDLAGVFGIVSYPRVFGRVHGETWQDRVTPHMDVRGQTVQDLAYVDRYPSDPIEFHYVTDRRGFRNAADREDADIYLVGDSILVAGLLPIHDTITSLLEKDLGVRTMNIAVAGLAVQEERDLFKSAKLPLEGRLVLHFVYEGNDLQESAEYGNKPRTLKYSLQDRLFSYNLFLWLLEQTDSRPLPRNRRIGIINDTEYLFSGTKHAFPGADKEFARVCDALLEMRETVQAGGGTYAIVFFPEKTRVLAPFCIFGPDSANRDYAAHLSLLRAWLTDWCAKEGIPLLDLTDALSASTQAGKVPWFPADTHPDAVGHRVSADAIKQWNVVTSWRDSRGKENAKPSDNSQ